MSSKYILIIIIGTVMIFTTLITHTAMHEQAHEQIAYQTGGYNCEIDLFFGGGTTVCEDFGDLRFHALNEIVGYNILTIAQSMLLSALLISIAIMIKK